MRQADAQGDGRQHRVGMTARREDRASGNNRLPTPCTRPFRSTTPVSGLADIRVVPMWWQAGRSRSKTVASRGRWFSLPSPSRRRSPSSAARMADQPSRSASESRQSRRAWGRPSASTVLDKVTRLSGLGNCSSTMLTARPAGTGLEASSARRSERAIWLISSGDVVIIRARSLWDGSGR